MAWLPPLISREKKPSQEDPYLDVASFGLDELFGAGSEEFTGQPLVWGPLF